MDALRAPATASPAPVLLEEGEAEALAARLALAYRRAVDFYVREYKLSPAEAHEKANGRWADVRQVLLETPAREFSWGDFQGLEEVDQAEALARWQAIKTEAAEAVRSGVVAADAVESSWTGTPWQRAQFLAIRAEFARDWQPRGGIEQTLVDQMAQAYTLQLQWTARLVQRSDGAAVETPTKYDGGRWQPPRVSEAEAVQEAAGMVDRWNRMFLRNLRALRDMRRLLPGPVIVNNAGQVNIAAEGGQQVNVAEPF
jgi:hypothetical protein